TVRADCHYVLIQHLLSGLFSARIRSVSASPAAGARGDGWTEGRLLRSRINPFANVKHCRLQVELLTEIRNPNLLQKVAPEDDDLPFRGAVLTLFSHTFSPYYLSGERFFPFPAEAGTLVLKEYRHLLLEPNVYRRIITSRRQYEGNWPQSTFPASS